MSRKVNYVSKATDGTYTVIIKGNVMKVIDQDNNEGIKIFSSNEKFDISRGFWNCFKQIKEARKNPKIGDMVRIIDDGEIYEGYWKWFNDFNMAKRFDFNESPDTTKIYKVVDIGPHEDDSAVAVVAIENTDGKIYLINSHGLQKV